MSDPFNRDHPPRVGQELVLEQGLSVVTAPNASPMTFTGTQTYLLGTDTLAVLDPGPDNPAHLDALLQVIAGRPVSHIIVTHSHVDHCPLSRSLSEHTGAKIWGFGSAHEARSPVMERLAQMGDLGGNEGIDQNFSADHKLADGDRIAGDGWTLEAIHTPGHLSNHLCFAWLETDAVFSGDHVMGWATTMVSPPDGDLTEFMKSLSRLQTRTSDRVYYPGHGAPVTDPAGMVAHQLAHRKMREAQIMETLGGGGADAFGLAKRIYSDVDQRLIPAAARNVFAHLIDLSEREIVEVSGDINKDSIFTLK